VKKLPIGVSDFYDMIKKNYYYVDKSLLIKDIVDLPGVVKLITRPRRFGKTLNMRMLEQFFSMEGEEGLFDGLKVWQEKALLKDYYHQYPTIFITFKEIKDTTWENAKVHLKAKFSEDIKKYLQNEMIRKGDRDYLEKAASKELEIEEYTLLLKTLTRIYYELYKKKTILLIDEYDVPIEAAYTYKEKDSDYYDNMVTFMRNLLTAALKDNEYLEFGILTGVYRVAKESIFSGLNNLAVYTIFENSITDKFGFTEEEVSEILKHFEIDTKEDREIIKKWYSNYRIGNREDLYNPWSILNYISSRLMGLQPSDASQPYWTNTSSNDLIIKQIETNPVVKDSIEELLRGEEIIVTLDPWLSLRELEDDPNGVWTLFASAGYITAKRVDINRYYIKIPNEELLFFFKTSVMKWLQKATKSMAISKMMNSLYDLIKEGKYEKFKKNLEDYMRNILSYHDLGFEDSEHVYKAFLLGILSIAINGFEVENEMESGYGRLDVAVYPKEKRYGKYAAVFEIKRADSEEKLEEAAKQVLKQIKEKEYRSKLEFKGYKVIGFGIAFCGKRAETAVEIL